LKPVPAGIQIVGVTRLSKSAALEHSPPSAKKERQTNQKKAKKNSCRGLNPPPKKKFCTDKGREKQKIMQDEKVPPPHHFSDGPSLKVARGQLRPKLSRQMPFLQAQKSKFVSFAPKK